MIPYRLPNQAPLPQQRPSPMVSPVPAGPSAAPTGFFGQMGGLLRQVGDRINQNPGRLTRLGALFESDPQRRQEMLQSAQGVEADAAVKQGADLLLSRGMAATPQEALAMAKNPQLAGLLMKDTKLFDDATSRAKIATEILHLTPDSPEYQRFVGAGSFGNLLGGESGSPFGKTVIRGIGPDGKERAGVVDTTGDGSVRWLDTGGVELAGPTDKVDLGSRWAIYDHNTGQLLGYEEKDLAGEEELKALGVNLAKTKIDYDAMTAGMPGLKGVVAQLRQVGNTATYTPGGQLVDTLVRAGGIMPREASVAREKYKSMISNQIMPILRDTLGTQFTQADREQLERTMGSADLAPTEKTAILQSFIEQKQRDLETKYRSLQLAQERVDARGGGGGGGTAATGDPAVDDILRSVGVIP